MCDLFYYVDVVCELVELVVYFVLLCGGGFDVVMFCDVMGFGCKCVI